MNLSLSIGRWGLSFNIGRMEPDAGEFVDLHSERRPFIEDEGEPYDVRFGFGEG